MHIGKKGIVDLHIQPGIGDRLVFLVQRFGECEQTALFVGVVLDLCAGEGTRRRDDWQESGKRRVLRPGCGEAGSDVADIAADLVLTAIGDRAVDHDAIAETFAQTGGGIVLGIKFRKGRAILSAGHGRHRILQFLRRGRPHGNAFEPLENIERPIEPFTEFAIADDVDADLRLLADDLDDRLGETGFEGGLVIWLAIFDRSPELDQFRRPDQTADMGGENAIGVVRHVECFSCRSLSRGRYTGATCLLWNCGITSCANNCIDRSASAWPIIPKFT